MIYTLIIVIASRIRKSIWPQATSGSIMRQAINIRCCQEIYGARISFHHDNLRVIHSGYDKMRWFRFRFGNESETMTFFAKTGRVENKECGHVLCQIVSRGGWKLDPPQSNSLRVHHWSLWRQRSDANEHSLSHKGIHCWKYSFFTRNRAQHCCWD